MAIFERAYTLTAANEGGYQKDPNDPGNYNSRDQLVGTNHGISARFYEDLLGYPPSEAEMRAISKEEARAIYKEHFWDQYRYSQLENQDLANQIFDITVNHGYGNALDLVQKVVPFEASTVTDALNRVKDPIQINNALAQARKEFVRNVAPEGWAGILVNRAMKYVKKNH